MYISPPGYTHVAFFDPCCRYATTQASWYSTVTSYSCAADGTVLHTRTRYTKCSRSHACTLEHRSFTNTLTLLHTRILLFQKAQQCIIDLMAGAVTDEEPALLWRQLVDTDPVAARLDAAVCNDLAEHQQCDPTQLLPHLWLGSLHAAKDVAGLQHRGITACLSLCAVDMATDVLARKLRALGIRHTDDTSALYVGTEIEYAGICALDESTYPLLCRHFAQANLLVERHRAMGGATLVHCQAGRNRSGAMTVALVHWFHQQLASGALTGGMNTGAQPSNTHSIADAAAFVHAKRGTLLSNLGFRSMLMEWASSVQQQPTPGTPGKVVPEA